MIIEQLKLFNFRNLAQQSIKFSPEINYIIGNNGHGKTNIIEAINLLASTKSFRTNTIKDLIFWGEEAASVFGQIDTGSELGVVISRNTKEFIINGDSSTVTQFLGQLSAVVFSPSDINIIKGGPSFRRKLIDRIVIDCYPKLLHKFQLYNRALKHKQTVLKLRSVSYSEVEPWNKIMAEAAYHINCARQEAVNMITTLAHDIQSQVSQQRDSLKVRLINGFKNEFIDSERVVHESFAAVLADEIRTGITQVGLHKSDLVITINGKNTRFFASQGQSKLAILAIKLAAIQAIENLRGNAPIVLLDDLDSELDSERCSAVHNLLFKKGRQFFITGTQLPGNVVPDNLAEITIFNVQEGVVSSG